MALTDKDLRFIDHYFMCGYNATQAYMSIHPKCKITSARAEGWKTLVKPHIREEINRRETLKRSEHKLTVAHVENLLRDFAEVDVLDIFTEQGDLKPLSEIPPSARRAIASIEVEEVWSGRGAEATSHLVKKVKLVDKRGAAELLGKWKKMFTDKVEHSGADGGPLRIAVSINGIKKGQG